MVSLPDRQIYDDRHRNMEAVSAEKAPTKSEHDDFLMFDSGR